MSTNGTSESGCESEVRTANSTCGPDDLSVTASIVSMTGGILSNSLALFVLVKSYHRIRLKSKASFLLFASGLVVTDLLGHLVNGSLVLFIHSSHKQWEAFDPDRVLCGFFGASLVFFGLSPLLLGCTMAVERCLGVTRPLFHSTAVAPRHVKRLLGSAWSLAALVAGLPTLMVRTHRAALPVHVNAALSFRPVTPRAGARDERLCCMSCRRCSVAAHKPFASDLMSFPSSLMFSQSPFHVLKVGRHFVDRGSRTHVQIRADAHSSFIMHALV